MLPYYQDEAFYILNFFKKSKKFKTMEIDFKIHPDFIKYKKKYMSALEKKWKIIDTYPTPQEYGFVISTGSSSILELICMGLSALVIIRKNYLISNPLPKFGKSENWESIKTIEELEEKYLTLLKFRLTNIQKFKRNIFWYKENFFIEPMESNIVKAFELDKRSS